MKATNPFEFRIPSEPYNQIMETSKIFCYYGWNIQLQGDLGTAEYTQDIDYTWHWKKSKYTLRFDSISHIKFWLVIDSDGNVQGDGYGPYGLRACYYIIDNGKKDLNHFFTIRDLNNENFVLDLIFVDPKNYLQTPLNTK